MSWSLAEMLPVYGVEDGCLLSKQGDYTLGFRMEKPEVFTLSSEDFERIHDAFLRAIRVLPPHSILHMQDWFLRERFVAEKSGEKSFLAGCSERFFNGRLWMRQESYLFLTRKPKDRKESSSAASSLLRRRLVPEEALDAAGIREFRDLAAQFVRILEDSGFLRLHMLDSHELWSQGKKAGLLERYCTLDGDKPVLRDIELRDGIRIGEHHGLLLTLADAEDLPGQCATHGEYGPYSGESVRYPIGFASGLGLLLDVDHIYNQFLFVGDGPATLKKLESRRLRLQSLANYSRENSIAEEAVNEYLNEAIGEQRMPVRAHYNILVWTDRKDELGELRSKVAGAIANLEASPHLETVGAGQIWWAGLPGNEAEFPMNETFQTFAEQACCFFHVEDNYRSSSSPFGFRLGDRLTGRPLHVDIDDEPRRMGWTGNGNMFVLSGSGGGKSYWMNHLVRYYYEQGMHILIVDVGHSYETQCALHGGIYLTYREDDPIRFNPFYLSPGEVMDTEKRESIKGILFSLWKKEDEVYRRAEYVALSSALQGYYDKLAADPTTFPCFDTFYEYLRDEYGARVRAEGVKEHHFDFENFLYVLRPYYKGGEFDYLLNAKQNLDLLHERFVVLELDTIRDHAILLPVVTMIATELFIGKMRKLKGIRKMIVIEEAWKAIAREGMAENLKYLFKTARKFYAKACVVTQEVEDILSSEVIQKSIIANSDIRILLDQSKFQNLFGDIQRMLGITEKQKAEILSINKGHEPGPLYKDLWIGLGAAHSKVYRLETSPEEYQVYTSEQHEKVVIRQYVERYGDMETSIRQLVKDLKERKSLKV